MTDPSHPPQSEDQQQANVAYVLELQTTFARWKKRGMFLVWPVCGVVFLATLLILSQVAPETSLGVFIALAAAFVAMMVMMMFVLPALPMPSLRCPNCSGRVPMLQPTKPFKPYEPYHTCPHCSRTLPV